MRPYLIALAILALAVGGLFRAADMTGIKLLKMTGVIGIFLFGVVGTLALVRWQGETGRKETEKALQGLGPDFLITDWSASAPRHGIPEYLVVAAAGLYGLTLMDAPQGGRRSWPQRVARARGQARATADWVARTLAAGPTDANRADDTAAAPPVAGITPILVLTRRPALAEDSADGVLVVNPEGLGPACRGESAATADLSLADRVRITRRLRAAAAELATKTITSNVKSRCVDRSERPPL